MTSGSVAYSAFSSMASDLTAYFRSSESILIQGKNKRKNISLELEKLKEEVIRQYEFYLDDVIPRDTYVRKKEALSKQITRLEEDIGKEALYRPLNPRAWKGQRFVEVVQSGAFRFSKPTAGLLDFGEKPFSIKILNSGEIVHSMKELTEAAIDYL